jgi:SMC interacting uncharacterized protein involved in chromosome segregation
MAMDETRANLIIQNLAAQRNQFADECVNLRVEIGLRDEQIRTLTEQVEALKKELLKLATPQEVFTEAPLIKVPPEGNGELRQ